ncbi:hypothetical protein ACHQM5_005453 [Ranunculus cassubicifolius]
MEEQKLQALNNHGRIINKESPNDIASSVGSVASSGESISSSYKFQDLTHSFKQKSISKRRSKSLRPCRKTLQDLLKEYDIADLQLPELLGSIEEKFAAHDYFHPWNLDDIEEPIQRADIEKHKESSKEPDQVVCSWNSHLPKLDCIEKDSHADLGWLDFVWDGLPVPDIDSIGLEIPMDDLSDLNMSM